VRDRLINGATALCSTPSYALHLAEVARERGVPLDKLGVRVMVHAGEPGAGIPTVRARIEAAWGAKACDHPGMTEMGARLSGSTGASWGAWTT
jgi:phenylacetate-CoA ligase